MSEQATKYPTRIPVGYIDKEGNRSWGIVSKWYPPQDGEEPGCNLVFMVSESEEDEAAVRAEARVPHISSKKRTSNDQRGWYWAVLDTASLTPGPVPTSGPASGPPP